MKSPNRSLYLAGAKKGPLAQEIPNITPDKQTGIGDWSRNDIAELCLTGTKPDLDKAEGLMAKVISRRLRIKLNDSGRIVLADVGDRSASP